MLKLSSLVGFAFYFLSPSNCSA